MSEGEYRCFVGNLDPSINSDALHDAFRDCGAICAKVVVDKRTGKSQGFGNVDFVDQESMDEAILMLNGTDLGGAKISVHQTSFAKSPTTNSRTPRRNRLPDMQTGGKGAKASFPKSSSLGGTRHPSAGKSRGASMGNMFFSLQESPRSSPLRPSNGQHAPKRDNPPKSPNVPSPNGLRSAQSFNPGGEKFKDKTPSKKSKQEKKSWMGFFFPKSATSVEARPAVPKSASAVAPRAPVTAPQGRPRALDDSEKARGFSLPLESQRRAMP